jgi:hypothetical protein
MSAMRTYIVLCMVWAASAAEDVPVRPAYYLEVAATDSATFRPIRCFAVADALRLVSWPPETWQMPSAEQRLSLNVPLYVPGKRGKEGHFPYFRPMTRYSVTESSST